MQNGGGGLRERVMCMTSGRREGGVVPDEESQGPSCNILSKNLRLVTLERQRQYSSLFGRLEADQRKVCELQQLGTTPLMST